jgi:hypothetical protein
MIETLCVSPRCCRGPDGDPEPRRAADGLALCLVCRNRLARDALLAAVRYADLSLIMAPVGTSGEKVANSGRDRSVSLNSAAVECRSIIRHTLAAMARMISEERGFQLPADTVPAMARYVATSAEWLAAHPAAAEHSEELGELAHGRPRAVAYPDRRTSFSLASACPETVQDASGALGPCPGTLRAVLRPTEGSRTSSAIMCDHDEDHAWSSAHWSALADALEPAA